MSNLKFSVITPSFNQGEYIEENLRSIENQGYDNYEHIVIDGGSTDSTIAILKKYPRIRWISENDRGQSDAINKGFRMATGDIIVWLNSDDCLLPGVFNFANFWFSSNDEIGFVGNLMVVDKSNNVLQVIKPEGYDYDYLLNDCMGISQPSTLFRKEVLNSDIFLDENLHYAMDRDFFVRVTKTHGSLPYVDYDIAKFRYHIESKSARGPYNFAKDLLKIKLRYKSRFISRTTARILYIIITQPLRIIKRWLLRR